MLIGADASHLRWKGGGLGRYLDGLLHALEEELSPDDGMVAFYNSFGGPRLFEGRVRERNVRMPGSLLWNQVGLPGALLRDRCDVFLGGANLLPIAAKLPKVLVVHDCKAFRMPEADTPRWVRYLRRWMRASARAATRLVAISEWAASECEEFLGVRAKDVTVIYQGVDERFREALGAEIDQDRTKVRHLGIDGRFVLQVGGYEPHKGAAVAESAVAELRRVRPDVMLVRCGQAGRPGRSGPVLDLGYVPDDVLAALYRAASAVCVPSTHEGFGLPVLEAMACGTPVVTSTSGGLPEAGGDAALYAPAGDPSGFAAALAHLLDDADEREHRVEAGRARARRFRWGSAAAAMKRVLQDAMQQGR